MQCISGTHTVMLEFLQCKNCWQLRLSSTMHVKVKVLPWVLYEVLYEYRVGEIQTALCCAILYLKTTPLVDSRTLNIFVPTESQMCSDKWIYIFVAWVVASAVILKTPCAVASALSAQGVCGHFELWYENHRIIGETYCRQTQRPTALSQFAHNWLQLMKGFLK